jgi:hypothetical protein
MLQLVGDKGSSSALELQDATAPADCFLRGARSAVSAAARACGAQHHTALHVQALRHNLQIASMLGLSMTTPSSTRSCHLLASKQFAYVLAMLSVVCRCR